MYRQKLFCSYYENIKSVLKISCSLSKRLKVTLSLDGCFLLGKTLKVLKDIHLKKYPLDLNIMNLEISTIFKSK